MIKEEVKEHLTEFGMKLPSGDVNTLLKAIGFSVVSVKVDSLKPGEYQTIKTINIDPKILSMVSSLFGTIKVEISVAIYGRLKINILN